MTNYLEHIRTIENFPETGVCFYDIAPLLGNGAIFAATIAEMSEPLHNQIDKVVGFDARGFIFGAAVAHELGIGFAMLRKPGKLPSTVETIDYGLEYGTNRLEMQIGDIHDSDRIVLIDDVIATGGTACAGIELVRRAGGKVVSFSALLDLPALGGSKAINELDVPVHTLVQIEGE